MFTVFVLRYALTSLTRHDVIVRCHGRQNLLSQLNTGGKFERLNRLKFKFQVTKIFQILTKAIKNDQRLRSLGPVH